MTADHYNWLVSLLRSFYADPPTKPPADWCTENLWFDEKENQGPFSLLGREYAREPINTYADSSITDLVLVFGSQSGKTVIIMGGMCWLVCNDSRRIFWVMPTQDLVRKFSGTRWMPMLRRTPLTAAMIPTGAERHNFAKLEQHIGGAIIDFQWSNSPAALSSTPASVVNQDEVDKFPCEGGKEADAIDLADQRAKNFPFPKRTKTSTPTLVEGPIWQYFLKTDQGRRFGPCPSCKKMVVFVWSKRFTVFPIVGNEAFIVWDKEAKRDNGAWDMDRVDRSARAECPHCGFHIRDAHKTVMDREGVWIPAERRCKNGVDEVAPAPGHRGFHLPSLWAPSPQCNFGALARKFLEKKSSLMGLQGFINGDLAEPFESQDIKAERVELITADIEPETGEVGVITCDYQQNAPHIWWLYQKWKKGHTKLMDYGWCNTFEELRQVQEQKKVLDKFVCIDAGHEPAIIHEQCARWGIRRATDESKKFGRAPLHVGWTPFLGMKEENFYNSEMKAEFPVRLSKFGVTALNCKMTMPVYELCDKKLKDFLTVARRGQCASLRWEVSEAIGKGKRAETLWQHLDAEIRVTEIDKKTNRPKEIWKLRSHRWPNHLGDCAKAQIGVALYHDLILDPELPKRRR